MKRRTSQLESIRAFLPEMQEYVEGYEPGWNREAIIESPQQKLQGDTHAILQTALEALAYFESSTCPKCGGGFVAIYKNGDSMCCDCDHKWKHFS